MALPKGLGWLGALAALSLALAGCFAPGDEDNPVINPNVEAVLTTGTTQGGGSGIGSPGTGALSISPTAVRIPINETMTFSAAGGSPPYTFLIVSAPANGTITAAGTYTAGSTPGTARIQVKDTPPVTTPPTAANISEASVTIYNPATDPAPYRIVCTDVSPPSSTVTVPIGTMVNFRIDNGLSPDSFNVTNASNGAPQGFVVATRMGKWQVGSNGNNNGSVLDVLTVFDSSTPINVAVLRVYVCTTPLVIRDKFAIVPSGSAPQLFSAAASGGVGNLSWSIPVNGSNAAPLVVSPTVPYLTATYSAGTNTHGVFGATDIVQVRDSFPVVPQVAQARVSVPGLSAIPASANVRTSTSRGFTAFGGVGTYTWSRLSTPPPYSASGSTFPITNGATINYTTGPNEGLDILQVSDGTAGGTIRIPITVCNAITNRVFTPNTTSYYPATGTVGGFYPLDIAVDDFDNDGMDDVAVPMYSSASTPTPKGNALGNEVGILMTTGTPGTFAASSTRFTLPGGPGPWGITTGDFNADGNRDIALACYTTNSVIVMYGDGTGGFPNTGSGNLNYTTVNLGGGFGATSIVSYNLDRAGGDDLVVCDGLGGRVAVLISSGGGAGNPPGGFTIAQILNSYDPVPNDSVLPQCYGVTVANFNNDSTGSSGRTGNGPNGIGLVDIAVADYAHDYVCIFPAETDMTTGGLRWNDSFATGAGTHANFFNVRSVVPPQPLPATNRPAGIAWGNFGGDTLPDIVVANNGLSTWTNRAVSVLINTSTGGTPAFAAAVEFGALNQWPDWQSSGFWDVVVGDFDCDGFDDFAVSSRCIRQDPVATYTTTGCGMHVWRGLGTNSFNGFSRFDTWATFYQFGQSFHPTGIAMIDFGGQLHGSPGGAPLPDLILSAACTQSGFTYYGKLIVCENRSN